jgi:hypothetical protein
MSNSRPAADWHSGRESGGRMDRVPEWFLASPKETRMHNDEPYVHADLPMNTHTMTACLPDSISTMSHEIYEIANLPWHVEK